MCRMNTFERGLYLHAARFNHSWCTCVLTKMSNDYEFVCSDPNCCYHQAASCDVLEIRTRRSGTSRPVASLLSSLNGTCAHREVSVGEELTISYKCWRSGLGIDQLPWALRTKRYTSHRCQSQSSWLWLQAADTEGQLFV